jgi:prolyl oligopeptidase
MLQKIACFCLLFFSVAAFAQQYPLTKKTPSKITKFNSSYQDDYTWLEDMQSTEVNNWKNAQNEVANQHLDDIKKSWSSASKIKEYDFFSSNGLPRKKGKYFYSIYRKDNNRPTVLCYRKKINDLSVEVFNPYKIYNDANVRIIDYAPSKNSQLIAVNISRNGSDKTEIRFADLNKLSVSDESLTNIKTSNMSWNQDLGIFYKKNNNARTFEKDSTYQLYYHKIGSLQKDDALVFDTTKSENNFSFMTVENKLLVHEYDKELRHHVYYQASLMSDLFTLEKYLENEDSDFDFLSYRDGRVYFSSNKSDWGDIRSLDVNNHDDEKVVVPQIYTHLLTNSYFYGDYIICSYKTLGKNYIIVYDKNGGFIRRFDVPENMDFRINFLNFETKELFVSFYSFTIPYLNYTLNLETGKTNPFFTDYLPPKPTLFPFDHFVTTAITYKSRDNEDIPITIVYKKGLQLDGNNPTLLKAYGGYGTVSGPTYSTGLLYFLEKGGVYAYAQVRGGGEKGRKWYLAGKGLNKVNTFNDFIDAAEFLIREKYTSPNKLAITGTSHGGLVVGVAMTKRPDLFKVVIPKMGPFDMAQYGRFTVGELNYREYGNPEREDEYKSLLGFSPFHHIEENVNYPVTLIITSENDDRVPPVHSYKFAAKLQNRAAQKNPIYLETLGNSGHGGKISTYAGFINEEADFYNFLLYHLNQ